MLMKVYDEGYDRKLHNSYRMDRVVKRFCHLNTAAVFCHYPSYLLDWNNITVQNSSTSIVFSDHTADVRFSPLTLRL